MDSNTRRLDQLPKQRIDPADLDPKDADNVDGKPCPKCDGTRIWARAYTGGAGIRQDIEVARVAGASWFNAHTSQCAALVCLDCGFTEFYTLKPLNLIRRKSE